MLQAICPKLPMRNKAITRDFYVNKLGFEEWGTTAYDAYLMVAKDGLQIHFFEHATLDPLLNYGQVYLRTDQIEMLYQSYIADNVPIYPAGKLELKPWGQLEFSVLDPDHNLLTFGADGG